MFVGGYNKYNEYYDTIPVRQIGACYKGYFVVPKEKYTYILYVNKFDFIIRIPTFSGIYGRVAFIKRHIVWLSNDQKTINHYYCPLKKIYVNISLPEKCKSVEILGESVRSILVFGVSGKIYHSIIYEQKRINGVVIDCVIGKFEIVQCAIENIISIFRNTFCDPVVVTNDRIHECELEFKIYDENKVIIKSMTSHNFNGGFKRFCLSNGALSAFITNDNRVYRRIVFKEENISFASNIDYVLIGGGGGGVKMFLSGDDLYTYFPGFGSLRITIFRGASEIHTIDGRVCIICKNGRVCTSGDKLAIPRTPRTWSVCNHHRLPQKLKNRVALCLLAWRRGHNRVWRSVCWSTKGTFALSLVEAMMQLWYATDDLEIKPEF